MSYTYKYPRPAVTTDAIIICKENGEFYILFIERGIDPFKGYWALPGGFVEIGEELEVACARELKEETKIECVELEQFATIGTVGRDPRGRTISVVYWAIVDNMLEVKSGDDASNACWFKLTELPLLAFDHSDIIAKFVQEKLIGYPDK